MTKLLKCPKCEKHITYLSTSTECTEYEHACIDDIGNFVITESYTDDHCAQTYICPKCGFETHDYDNFITEIDCVCEHSESSIEKYGGYDIEVCQHCGLVISNEIAELIQ